MLADKMIALNVREQNARKIVNDIIMNVLHIFYHKDNTYFLHKKYKEVSSSAFELCNMFFTSVWTFSARVRENHFAA